MNGNSLIKQYRSGLGLGLRAAELNCIRLTSSKSVEALYPQLLGTILIGFDPDAERCPVAGRHSNRGSLFVSRFEGHADFCDLA